MYFLSVIGYYLIMMNEHTTRDYSLYSDVHKDAYGFRPRDWDRVEAMTDAEFEEEIDYLCKRAQEEAEREDREEAAALARWQERISAEAAAQSVDVATMVRWEMQAQDEDWVEHYVWDQGVGCGRHMTAAKEWLRGHGVERV